jgi:flagellar biosynthetic protein FliQ
LAGAGRRWYHFLMEQADVIDLVRETIIITIQISAPIMLIGLFVGVIIALLQALTQIQEVTLVFVPKILAIFFAMFVLFPGMISILTSFSANLADRIVGIQ